MADIISQITRDKIDTFLCQVADGYQFDEDTIRELKSHILEKLSKYLHGDVPIDENDALILVFEHFGNPKMIREFYQQQGLSFSSKSFFRLFSVAVILLTITVFFEQILPQVFGPIIGLMVMTKILHIYKKKERDGHAVWYYLINPNILFLLMIGCILLAPGLTDIANTLRSIAFEDSSSYAWYFGALYLAIITSHYVVFLWWFDRSPRLKIMSAGIFALLVFHISSWLVGKWLYMYILGNRNDNGLPYGMAIGLYILIILLTIIVYPLIIVTHDIIRKLRLISAVE